MSIDNNDPRLTQYALGEMDAAEATQFELELDTAARADVDAIRAMAGLVGAELQAEPAPELERTQRRAIEHAAGGKRRVWLIGAATIAATLLIAIGLGGRPESQDGQHAMRDDIGDIIVISTSPGPGDQLDLEDSADGYNALDRKDLVTKDSITVQFSNSLRPIVLDPNSVNNPNRNVRLFYFDLQHPRGTEAYDRIRENVFHRVRDMDASTFSIDVDTASYANVRRFLLQDGRLPPSDAVRIEELVNYFSYDYEAPGPEAEHPFATHVEVAGCPWDSRHRLARIALKGKTMERKNRKAANLVFLLDVSGSMSSDDKLPLLKQSLKLLVENLDKDDRVAIVVYAGASGMVLDSTPAAKQAKILGALDRLGAGGSTNGGAGIQLAYEVAAKHFIKGGVNRIVLCTDGDFNVGVTDRAELTRLIEEKAKSNVFLSVLGFGRGNLQDATMEELSNRGNGNYAYIDTLREAQKVLGEQVGGTLVTIAKDVKIQLFFNPARVAGWRLIGYENRLLATQDFNDDKKDAGEIGAGHSVTALYELVPAGLPVPGAKVDANPFKQVGKAAVIAADPEALFQIRLRYKQPDGNTSVLQESYVRDSGASFDAASRDFHWAAAVAAFGMRLRQSNKAPGMSWDGIREIAKGALGRDAGGYRGEFLELCDRAAALER